MFTDGVYKDILTLMFTDGVYKDINPLCLLMVCVRILTPYVY